ncbi:YqkE family protein [Sediminibacillus massiliensis]|uniref:YqkE family protein n=1 Tax=Sediminibacillus massiliensis TaxID=1926277 RepID=UPI0009887087|nr:YqkE family protein [Sediminibacillus massiliensis]
MKKDRKTKDGNNTLKERLNQSLVEQLRSKKNEWKVAEEKEKETERLRKIEERKQREANKSFEELLKESDMDWKKYK